MDEIDRELYRIAYLQGQADARAQCDICPQRFHNGIAVLIPPQDLLRRTGIEN